MASHPGLTEKLTQAAPNGAAPTTALTRGPAMDEALRASSVADDRADNDVARILRFADDATRVQRYGLAVLVALIAAGYAFVFDAAGVKIGMFAVPVLMIVVLTFVAGARPGIVATVLTVTLIEIFVQEQRFNLDFDNEEFIGFGVKQGVYR